MYRCANNWAPSRTQFIPDCSRSLSFPQRALRVICGCTTTNWCAQRIPHLNRLPRPPQLLIHTQPQHHQQHHHPQHSPPQHPTPPSTMMTTCSTRACRASFRNVDISLLLALTASRDNHPNQLEYQKWYLRLAGRWEHVKHLFKRSQGLSYDITLCTVGVLLGMRVKDYTSARAAAFKFIA